MTESGKPARRQLILHGHFYQPPRENPWTGAVETELTALPWHDWNRRIAAECYAPNAAARILDDRGEEREQVNNYAWLSFDFGPTLLSWLGEHEPETYRAVIAADRESLERLGHGNAIAQSYHHVILPLATRRDRETEVRWGIADFRMRFGRAPEGIWLPETAVDRETLEVAAAAGIRFTILAPHQAARVRRRAADRWHPVGEDGIDTSLPYRCRLPGGREITVFFYDGGLSRGIAFHRLLDSGDHLLSRIAEVAGAAKRSGPLVTVANDGESYGHHHAFGEMALAYLVRNAAAGGIDFTNPSAVLATAPPAAEVEVRDQTSWSCAHGVERWRRGCGCGAPDGVKDPPEWRAPLREALEWLRDEIDRVYERSASGLLVDPWAARDAYGVVLGAPPGGDGFVAEHSSRRLGTEEQAAVWRLLEMERHRLAMFTSCGWFFDDVSRLETVLVLRHAARVIEIARGFGADLEDGFVARLRAARSHDRGIGDGRRVWQRLVQPSAVDLARLAVRLSIFSP